MKWVGTFMMELCLSRCCKLGNGAFWERMPFGRCPIEIGDSPQAFPSASGFSRHSSVRCENIELIEIRTRDAIQKSRDRACIAVFAVKTSDSSPRVKHAPKTEHSIE
jgi:hypothetical protein